MSRTTGRFLGTSKTSFEGIFGAATSRGASSTFAARDAGYWKWESTLTRTGECQTPSSEQIREYLEKTFAELGH